MSELEQQKPSPFFFFLHPPPPQYFMKAAREEFLSFLPLSFFLSFFLATEQNRPLSNQTFVHAKTSALQSSYPRTARVIGGLDSSDIFCNSDTKHFLA
jgi:hypothetical protein